MEIPKDCRECGGSCLTPYGWHGCKYTNEITQAKLAQTTKEE